MTSKPKIPDELHQSLMKQHLAYSIYRCALLAEALKDVDDFERTARYILQCKEVIHGTLSDPENRDFVFRMIFDETVTRSFEDHKLRALRLLNDCFTETATYMASNS